MNSLPKDIADALCAPVSSDAEAVEVAERVNNALNREQVMANMGLKRITTTTKLLRDVLEMLTDVADWAEGQADADHDGENFIPNRAMRIKVALDGNEYSVGLIARVSEALEHSR